MQTFKQWALYLIFMTCIVSTPFLVMSEWGPDAKATGTRVFNSPVRPMRLLAKQFSAGANNFTTSDPTPAGGNLTLTSATGNSKMDGSVTLALDAGFTAPITLTAYYWQLDQVTPANSCWVRLGPVASGGANNYSQTIDTNYASVTFAIPEQTPFLIQSSAAVTGLVYTDSLINPNNNNSASAGYNQ